MRDAVGIVLAGGASSRYGSPKAFAQHDGRYFYEIACAALEASSEHIIIVTREELVARFPPTMTVITDTPHFLGLGPLAGIYSAMTYREAARYIVLPCDMPFMTPAVIDNLTSATQQGAVTAVRREDDVYPLVSIWTKEVQHAVYEALINRRLSVMQLLQQVKTTWVEARQLTTNPRIVFQNINEPLGVRE